MIKVNFNFIYDNLNTNNAIKLFEDVEFNL